MSAPARSYRGKRSLDLAVLTLVAVPALLLSLAAAVAVRLTSRGPILFHQERVGLHGVPFDCRKFRTMVHGDNPLIPDPSRITSAGRWLRRFSLDELPQLVNVAKGDMSVVGPRPMLGFQAERCDPHQRRRFDVRPGLTGWAQINGRNALGWPERIELDLEYVERQSPMFDLRILLTTGSTILTGVGVSGHDGDDPFAASTRSVDGT